MTTRELPLPDLDTQRLAGLVFELASQLHAERLRRLALEAALLERGALTAEALARFATDGEVQSRAHAAVEDSVARLMRVLAERPDARMPLRPGSVPLPDDRS